MKKVILLLGIMLVFSTKINAQELQRVPRTVISVVKLNVVYRGLDNLIEIAIPSVPSNTIIVTGNGLSKLSKDPYDNLYVVRPRQGRTMNISVTGTLPDGTKITSVNEFRIKDIPRPSGTVRGEIGRLKMSRQNLAISTVGATIEDFDFDVNLIVKEFKIKIGSQPSITVQGDKLNSNAKTLLLGANKGDLVQIYDMKSKLTNNPAYNLKKSRPVYIYLTN